MHPFGEALTKLVAEFTSKVFQAQERMIKATLKAKGIEVPENPTPLTIHRLVKGFELVVIRYPEKGRIALDGTGEEVMEESWVRFLQDDKGYERPPGRAYVRVIIVDGGYRIEEGQIVEEPKPQLDLLDPARMP